MTSQWQGDRRSRNRETGWLDVLIEAFEDAEALHDFPCDERVLSLVRDRLELPSVLRARKLLKDYERRICNPDPLFACDL